MQRFKILFIALFLIVTISSRIEAQTSPPELYSVGINDLLQIKVLDHYELDTIVTVSQDGTISFPYLGTIYVKGMKLSEIEELIKKKLSEGYIKYPVVTVSLVTAKSRKIFTYGEFANRGQIPVEDNMTLLNVMSVAGGVTVDGLHGKITVKRRGKEKGGYVDVLETNLNNGLIEEKKNEDLVVKFDDIIVVEHSKTFLIQGEVTRSGRIVLEKNMTVLRALLQAGGVSRDALYGKIKVRRKQDGKHEEYRDIAEADLKNGVIEDKQVENTVLKPDDIIVVERSKTFLIQGEAATRGRFVLEKDMTVLRALLEAGGVSADGLYGKIKIRRKHDGQDEKYRDIAEANLNDGVIEDKAVENIVLQPEDILVVERSKTFLIQGEVARSGRFVLEKDMTVLRALLQAGGVSRDGLFGKIKVRRKLLEGDDEHKDIAETNLNNGDIEDKAVENIVLQADDIIVVDRNKIFFIYGEVNRPGELILESHMTVFKAITVSGGFTKWGSTNNVKILRKLKDKSEFSTIKVDIGDVIKGDATKDIHIQEGDIVVVSTGIF